MKLTMLFLLRIVLIAVVALNLYVLITWYAK